MHVYEDNDVHDYFVVMEVDEGELPVAKGFRIGSPAGKSPFRYEAPVDALDMFYTNVDDRLTDELVAVINQLNDLLHLKDQINHIAEQAKAIGKG